MGNIPRFFGDHISLDNVAALSVGQNAGIIPQTGIVNAHIAAAADIVGSKLADEARTHFAISDAISLTNSGAGTVSKAILLATKAITIVSAYLIHEAASNDGTVPNVEVGISGTLDEIVDAVAPTAESAQWTLEELTLAETSVDAGEIVVVSTVAAGATTNTGSVRVAIEYTVDDAA